MVLFMRARVLWGFFSMLHIWRHSLCYDIIMLAACATPLSPIDTSKMKLIRKQDQPVFFFFFFCVRPPVAAFVQ